MDAYEKELTDSCMIRLTSTDLDSVAASTGQQDTETFERVLWEYVSMLHLHSQITPLEEVPS